MSRWVSMICGEEAETLLRRHPNSFLLLAQIAMRAKWKDCPITNLKKGEAWIGDYKAAGLKTPKAYRHAQKVLEKCGLAAFKGASKGTVATLTNSEVFSIAPPARGEQTDHQGASKGQAEGEQGASNKTDIQNQGTNRTDDLFECGTKPAKKIQKSPTPSMAEVIWKAAPKIARQRSSRKGLWEALQKTFRAIDPKEIPTEVELLTSLEAWKLCQEWTKKDGEFIPGIHRWVSDMKWETIPDAPDTQRLRIIPNTPEMLALAGLFGRTPNEPWTSEEAELFIKQGPTPKQIHLLECFYALPSEALEPNVRKRASLLQLLNYWTEALDNARIFFQAHQDLYKPFNQHSAA